MGLASHLQLMDLGDLQLQGWADEAIAICCHLVELSASVAVMGVKPRSNGQCGD